MFDAGKTRMIGLPYGEKNYDDMLSRFHLIPERYGPTDGRTDRQTDRQTDGRTNLLYQYADVRYKLTNLNDHCRQYSLAEKMLILSI